MQRLLTGLVLFLVVAVAVLGISVYKLSSSTSSARLAPVTRTQTIAEIDPAAAQRDAEQERRISELMDEVSALKREMKARASAPAPSPAPSHEGGGGLGEGTPVVVAAPGVRPRDADGNLVITTEDVELFTKVQEQVLRQQRIDNQTRGVMLRIERMAGRGEINPLPDDRKKTVEDVLKKYVAKGDDLSARYLRSPDPDVAALTPEQRREDLTRARTDLVAQAQKELDQLLGPDDSKKISEEALQRPWGLGRSMRRFENDR
jgi:hypothetical protein